MKTNVLPTCLTLLISSCLFAAEPEGSTLYDRDPSHLWNRLHRALLVRVQTDGKVFESDAVDPLLWPNTKYLLVGPSHEQALKVLKEFVAQDGQKTIADPLKRALLQRDLFSVFNWAAVDRRGWGGEELDGQRRVLQAELARVIRRLALSEEQIRTLHDNYAAAVAVKNFAAKYDDNNPDKPFLPPDLFKADGAWVCVAGGAGAGGETLAAEQHSHFFSCRSVFLVFINLPGGRTATLEYLEKLNSFPTPLIANRMKDRSIHSVDPLKINEALPQFPQGTQLALVRQAVLISDAAKPVASRLTESVQIRVYRDLLPELKQRQATFEFTLQPKKLLQSEDGGLRAVEKADTSLLMFQHLNFAGDYFEEPPGTRHRAQPTEILRTCINCHRSAGIFSVNSITHDHFEAKKFVGLPPRELKQVQDAALEWVQRRPEWARLKELIREP